MDEATAITIAKNKKSSADQLLPLLNISDQVNRLLAKHPNSNSELLNELGKSLDDKTASLVAEHPNVPIEMLNNIGDYFPLSMFRNPALPNILKQDKNYLGIFFGEVFEKALKSKNIPDLIIDSLARNGKFEHQAIFLFGGGRDPSVYEKFYSSKHPKILSELLARDDKIYLNWAHDLGYSGLPNNNGENKSVREEIDKWVDDYLQKTSDLWKKLVPPSGESATLQGELIRAHGRILTEYHQNGMMNWGDGSGFYEKFTDLIHGALTNEYGHSKLVKSIIDADISEVKKSGRNGRAMATGKKGYKEVLGENFLIQSGVEKSHSRLGALIALWCERHPEPIPYPPA